MLPPSDLRMRLLVLIASVLSIGLPGISAEGQPYFRAELLEHKAKATTGSLHTEVQDLVEHLDNLIREKHVRPFWRQNQNEYEAVVDRAKKRLANENLTDEQRNVELLKVLAALRDGHSGMAAGSRDKLFGYIPITTAWFGEELRIVRTSIEYKETLGARIVSVEGTELAELKQQLLTVVPHANHERFKKLSPSYLQLPGLLKGLGIANSKDQAKFKLHLNSGETKDVDFKRMKDQQYENATFVTFDQFAESLPLCRQRADEDFWYEYLPEEKTFYFKYNRISAGGEQSIWTWAPAMWSKVDSLDIDKFVIDIRYNGGGGFQYSLPIIQGVLDRPNLNQRGKLFILTGYKTFSAAIGFLEQIEERTKAIIVGEPPCDYPASPGDPDKFPLGDTGIEIYLSRIFHSTLFPDDCRKSIGLDQQIMTTWADYAAGKDPLLTYATDYQSEEAKPTPENAFAWAGRYTYSAGKVLTLSKKDNGLRMEIGKFFSTPLYPKLGERYKTEIVGLEVELSDSQQIQLIFPDGKKQTYTRCNPDHVTPVELIYAGNFEQAKEGFHSLLKSNSNNDAVTDSALADTALLLYWDLVKEKGRTEAKKYARKTLEIAIELFDEAPMSEFSLRFYR